MKNSLITLLSLTLIFSTGSLYAEIYSWVDKDGKKHFGQEVPKEYAEKSKRIEVKSVNGMDETKVRPAQRNPTKPNYQEPVPSVAPDNIDENLSRCEQQKRAYQESVACYASCRLPLEESGGRVNNVSACGHCVDVKKPNC